MACLWLALFVTYHALLSVLPPPSKSHPRGRTGSGTKVVEFFESDDHPGLVVMFKSRDDTSFWTWFVVSDTTAPTVRWKPIGEFPFVPSRRAGDAIIQYVTLAESRNLPRGGSSDWARRTTARLVYPPTEWRDPGRTLPTEDVLRSLCAQYYDLMAESGAAEYRRSALVPYIAEALRAPNGEYFIQFTRFNLPRQLVVMHHISLALWLLPAAWLVYVSLLWRRIRLRAKVKLHRHGLLCKRCGYISGIHMLSTCPECGYPMRTSAPP